MIHIPSIIDKESKRTYDVYSRLLEDRVIFVKGQVNSEMANAIKAQIMYLDHVNNKDPIHLYIDSPGGCIVSGLSIVDSMHLAKAPIHTVANGMAASMGSIILAAGDKSMSTANARIMIHQPSMGIGGGTQLQDVKIRADYCDKLYESLLAIYIKKTGKDKESLMKDMERDNFMLPEEAMEYGLIEEVL